MGAGAVPVVIGKGGQREIVEDGVSGFLFQTEQELVARTRQVIEQPVLRARMAGAARERSGRFSQERFTKQAREIAGRVLESA
jgi:glycosyltransferase involved in cell wall biosynthesis